MTIVRIAAPPPEGQHVTLRLIGAGIVGFGIGAVATQLLSVA
jgi:hypothetical protein